MPKNKRIPKRRTNIFTPRRKTAPSRLTLASMLLLGLALAGLAISLNVMIPDETQSSIERGVPTDSVAQDYLSEADDTARACPPATAEQAEADTLREPELVRMTDTVKSGDTPTTLLDGHLSLADIYSLCDEIRDVYPLDRLKAGQPWTMIYSDSALIGLEYEIDANERLVVAMTDSGYDFRREPIPYEIETATLSGVIENSLFGSVLKLGENEDLAVRLANVFAYDIDFFRDLRTDDSFNVIVEKKYREGGFSGYGTLHAASFTNQGKTYYAYQFTDSKGHTAYYDQDGRPLRKAFLKAPLPFSRISSGFSMNRKHPILGFSRPHPAIDYAAPTGTPISAVADGTIAEAGYNNSQGNYVRIVHANGYDTTYNHMSKFAKGTKKGARVKQGTIIGYVGSTGLATGPHLCFRMRLNGKPINPLQLKSIPADPIAAKEMPAFKAEIATYRARLENHVRSAALPDAEVSVQ